jgi:hypothetical protein
MTTQPTTTHTDADRENAVIAGLSAPPRKATPKATPKAPRRTTKSPAVASGASAIRKAAVAARNGDAKPPSKPAKAPKPASKPQPKPAKATGRFTTEMKRELAALIVVAAGDAIRTLTSDELVQNYDGVSYETLAAQASQWLHYLPLGGVWPDGTLPKPDRSDWR